MEPFTSTQLTIPIMQVVLLLGLTTVSMLISRLKLALLINYCFTLYWGYIANIEVFSFTTAGRIGLNKYTFFYFGFGLVVLFLAVVGLITQRE
jgi:hypothetical protein